MSAETVCESPGPEHGWAEPDPLGPLSAHLNLTPDSVEEKENVASVAFVLAPSAGRPAMDGGSAGGVRSTVNERLATGLSSPFGSTALTSRV